MVDVTQVAVNGHDVPAVPGAAAQPTPGVPPLPAGAQQIAGFVPPAQAQPGQFTQADVDRQVAAALAAAAAGKAPPAANTPTPAPVQITSNANDSILDAYTEGFQALGENVDLERALGVALRFGKTDLIDTKYLREVGGAHADRLVKLGEAIVTHVQNESIKGVKASHDAAGGEANWNAASAAFNQGAPEHLKQIIGEMLNSGDQGKIASAAKMVVDFSKGNGYVPQPAGLSNPSAAYGVASQALSRSEFQAARLKVPRNAPDYNEQMNTLFAARRLGKQMGRD